MLYTNEKPRPQDTPQKAPDFLQVSLALCLCSILIGVVFFIVEDTFGFEVPSAGVISTALPAILTGIYFGNKTETLMSTKTRWLAILIWTSASYFYALAAFQYHGLSLSDLFEEFGSFGWVFAGFTALMALLSYFVIKSGEKTGIKNKAKVREKQAKGV
ncbi:ABZJ_00895 family protein [Enterovibrio norvegicus]|uniref:ABZJ_00895 family protein n=1 Tax=Enterovibrio norvegicus TaxID=188144 RepID=UPI0013D53EDA|nr:ABZJ_00895 family protein [Enterovibrio norvegicus]